MKLRSDYKDAFVEKHGVKLGLMSGFIKVCVCNFADMFFSFFFPYVSASYECIANSFSSVSRFRLLSVGFRINLLLML